MLRVSVIRGTCRRLLIRLLPRCFLIRLLYLCFLIWLLYRCFLIWLLYRYFLIRLLYRRRLLRLLYRCCLPGLCARAAVCPDLRFALSLHVFRSGENMPAGAACRTARSRVCVQRSTGHLLRVCLRLRICLHLLLRLHGLLYLRLHVCLHLRLRIYNLLHLRLRLRSHRLLHLKIRFVQKFQCFHTVVLRGLLVICRSNRRVCKRKAAFTTEFYSVFTLYSAIRTNLHMNGTSVSLWIAVSVSVRYFFPRMFLSGTASTPAREKIDMDCRYT